MSFKKKKLQPLQVDDGHNREMRTEGLDNPSQRQRKVTFDENDANGGGSHQRSRSNSDSTTSPREKGHLGESNHLSLRKRKEGNASGHSTGLDSPPYEEMKNLALSPRTEEYQNRRLSNSENNHRGQKDASFPSITVQDAERGAEKQKFKELSSPRLHKKESPRPAASVSNQHSPNPHRRININSLPLEGGGERLSPSGGSLEEPQKHMRRYTFSGETVDASVLPPAIDNHKRRKSSELDLQDRSGATSPWSMRSVSPSQKSFSSQQMSQPEKKFPVRLEPLQRERSRTTSK